MKIFNKNHLAFTLIEVIVAITIFSIILISVMSIYITSTDINLKTDITRALQQNVKSAVEVIAEDVRTSSKKSIKVENVKENI
jgi:prepilin-type N-terminal cleavage/methylation domain-containing protein